MLTESGKAAILRALENETGWQDNPFYTEGGNTYLRFDGIEFKDAIPDEFGMSTKEVTYLYRGVRVYTHVLPNVGPYDTVALGGITGRMQCSIG